MKLLIFFPFLISKFEGPVSNWWISSSKSALSLEYITKRWVETVESLFLFIWLKIRFINLLPYSDKWWPFSFNLKIFFQSSKSNRFLLRQVRLSKKGIKISSVIYWTRVVSILTLSFWLGLLFFALEIPIPPT